MKRVSMTGNPTSDCVYNGRCANELPDKLDAQASETRSYPGCGGGNHSPRHPPSSERENVKRAYLGSNIWGRGGMGPRFRRRGIKLVR